MERMSKAVATAEVVAVITALAEGTWMLSENDMVNGSVTSLLC